MRQVLHVRIRPGDPVVVDVIQGPGGSGCLDMLKPLVDAIGSAVETVDKPAMFETETEQETAYE